jgi:hypothetical protein
MLSRINQRLFKITQLRGFMEQCISREPEAVKNDRACRRFLLEKYFALQPPPRSTIQEKGTIATMRINLTLLICLDRASTSITRPFTVHPFNIRKGPLLQSYYDSLCSTCSRHPISIQLPCPNQRNVSSPSMGVALAQATSRRGSLSKRLSIFLSSHIHACFAFQRQCILEDSNVALLELPYPC